MVYLLNDDDGGDWVSDYDDDDFVGGGFYLDAMMMSVMYYLQYVSYYHRSDPSLVGRMSHSLRCDYRRLDMSRIHFPALEYRWYVLDSVVV